MDWVSTVAVIGSIGTIVAIPLSIFLYRKGIKKREPAWGFTTKEVIGLSSDAPPKLKLSYDGLQLDKVFRTEIIIFNKGKEVVDKTDLVEHISIQLVGGQLLDEPVVKVPSRKEIKFEARSLFDDKGAFNLVSFDFLFLDHDDGAVVEILHTKYNHLICNSNVKGAKGMVYLSGFKCDRSRSLSPKLFLLFGTLLAIMMISGSVFQFVSLGTSLHSIASQVLGASTSAFVGLSMGWLQSKSKYTRVFDVFPKWSISSE